MLWTALQPRGSISSRRDGGEHGSGNHDRVGHREVGLSGSRCRPERHSRGPAAGSASATPSVLRQAAGLIGIEACATAHHWARELIKLGHQVRLMPPSYVKPYVKRQKNDAADAEAICEAVTRPTMRFVEVKSVDQQGILVLHRVRLMLMRQRVQLSNAIRGHMAEFGLAAPIGREGLGALIRLIADKDERVPAEAQMCLGRLAAQLALINDQILETDRRIRTNARATEIGRRLMGVPGVGPLLASALVAAIPDPIPCSLPQLVVRLR
ncbi:IS110 family transposase (plasmid) [Bosea sp. F3-2]|nr:IS110 family transposase [Bosea sp. F3-2]